MLKHRLVLAIVFSFFLATGFTDCGSNEQTEGLMDTSCTDQFGKPCYRVSQKSDGTYYRDPLGGSCKDVDCFSTSEDSDDQVCNYDTEYSTSSRTPGTSYPLYLSPLTLTFCYDDTDKKAGILLRNDTNNGRCDREAEQTGADGLTLILELDVVDLSDQNQPTDFQDVLGCVEDAFNCVGFTDLNRPEVGPMGIDVSLTGDLPTAVGDQVNFTLSGDDIQGDFQTTVVACDF